MDLLNMVLNASKGDLLGKLAGQHNISTDQTNSILAQLLPELSNRVQSNVQQENGLESLLSALGKGNHQRYIDEPDSLTDSASLIDGNKILGHLLGSKNNSRQVASQVERSTGVSSSIIKKLLPMAATMLMGAMSKGAQRGGGNLLGSLLGGRRVQPGEGDLVGTLLRGLFK